MSEDAVEKRESALGTIIGWGILAVFTIGFAWYIGAPLLGGQRWSDKQSAAIQLVKDYKPSGTATLYDMIRAYAEKENTGGRYVGEFNWSAMQHNGPDYEVTLLWTEGSQRKVAVWRVNLETKEAPRPQGNEAAELPQRLAQALSQKP